MRRLHNRKMTNDVVEYCYDEGQGWAWFIIGGVQKFIWVIHCRECPHPMGTIQRSLHIMKYVSWFTSLHSCLLNLPPFSLWLFLCLLYANRFLIPVRLASRCFSSPSAAKNLGTYLMSCHRRTMAMARTSSGTANVFDCPTILHDASQALESNRQVWLSTGKTSSSQATQ